MYKKLSTKILFKHPRLIVEEDEIVLPSGENKQYIRYGYGGDGVVIIATNAKNEVLFIKDYSYVPNRWLLTLPMGKINSKESVTNAAKRELQEETKLNATKLVEVGYYYQNHRRSTNRAYVVIATGLIDSALPEDAEESGIKNIWVPFKDINNYIKNREISDTDTLSSLRMCTI